MEQAILINSLEGLERIEEKISRLYFGCEFCERLIPTVDMLRRALDVARERGLDFTLVTPFVTNAGIRALRPLFGHLLSGNGPHPEIVVNDWGALRVLNKEFSFRNMVLGRLLTKQKRDPRVLAFRGRVSARELRAFAETNCDVPELSRFLMESGVGRIELDNVAQGISREGGPLKASLYAPYVYLAAGRVCLAASCEKEKKSDRTIWPCQKECGPYALKLRHRMFGRDLFSRGSGLFFKNPALQRDLSEWNIDRLVHEPEIPR